MKIIKKVLFWLSIVLLATASIAPTTQVEARGGHGGGHGGLHCGGRSGGCQWGVKVDRG